ncbi:MAG TPA: pilus assembly protein TadG-related protein, partial [Acidimicrobiia bacterium]
MKELFRRARNEDRGAALALVAGSMVLLLGMAAFGSDLAWFYLNASRVQRTADAAALGGVIWLPA